MESILPSSHRLQAAPNICFFHKPTGSVFRFHHLRQNLTSVLHIRLLLGRLIGKAFLAFKLAAKTCRKHPVDQSPLPALQSLDLQRLPHILFHIQDEENVSQCEGHEKPQTLPSSTQAERNKMPIISMLNSSTRGIEWRHRGFMNTHDQGSPSHSASPSISASSHNRTSRQTSQESFTEALQANKPSCSGCSFAASIPQEGGMQFQRTSAVLDGPYSAQAPNQSQGSSSGNSSRKTSASDPIQVLTITTSQGQYTMPVDGHHASRLADEKRARNAVASARFRQRRKEKEKKASSRIEKLNQRARDLERRLRDTEQERDFYCRERDRLRDIVSNNPETRHLAAQAPPSAHDMRPVSFSAPMQQMRCPAPPRPSGLPLGHERAASKSERAPRRRRIDMHGDYTDVPYSHPPSSTLPPIQALGFAMGPETAPLNLPPLRSEDTTVPLRTTASSAINEALQQPPYGFIHKKSIRTELPR